MESEWTYLDLQKARFERALDGTLRMEILDDRCGIRVQVFRAFPLSQPEDNIVLRDGKDKELGIIEHLREVSEPARSWLREALFQRYFLPEIEEIYDITERFGTSIWDIETDRGRRTVTTRAMNEAVYEVEPGRFLITDVEGNRYELKDVNALDNASRARFTGKV